MPSGQITIIIVDDRAIVKAGLRTLIDSQPDMRLLDETANPLNAVGKIIRTRPDIILLDISSGFDALIETIEQIRGSTEARLVVLNIQDSPSARGAVLAAGAMACLSQNASPADLLSAIRTAHQSDLHSSEAVELERDSVDKKNSQLETLHRQLGFLSRREREVLELLVRGYTNAEIAAHLHLSQKTVETHRARIARKLGLKTRAELVRFALTMGILKNE